MLSADPDGNTCVDTEVVRLGREPSAEEDMQSETQFLQLLQTFALCPDAEVPQTTPALEALSFVRTIPFPTPEPHVAPGSLPVGFESFLETGAPTAQTFGPVPTPFGDLVVTATADIYVDWDDPHDEVAGEHGPYDAEPGPYPDGGIRHVYQYDGLYEIAVRYVWSVDWVIGGHSGSVPGIETTGTYPAPGFEAYSRQAVG